MAGKKKEPVAKRIFFVCVSQDIDHSLRWCLKNDFRSLITVAGYSSANTLKKAIEEKDCHALIVDSVVIDPLTDFIGKVKTMNPTLKILAILPSKPMHTEVKALTELNIGGIIARPFTPESLYEHLYQMFGFQKPKEINIFELKRGMVAADDIYGATGSEPLVECGAVLDEATIAKLVQSNIKRLKVHEDTKGFMNCWEYKQCGHFGRCPASIFVEADGYLNGFNAGRGCMYVKDTLIERESIAGKSFVEKLKTLCAKCEFCKMVAKESQGKTSHALFVEHIELMKDKKKNEYLTDDVPEVI